MVSFEDLQQRVKKLGVGTIYGPDVRSRAVYVSCGYVRMRVDGKPGGAVLRQHVYYPVRKIFLSGIEFEALKQRLFIR